MKRLLYLLPLFAALACTTASDQEATPFVGPPTPPGAEDNFAFHGGEGTDCDNAVVIKGAATTLIGLRAQNVWIDTHFPGAERLRTQQGDCASGITDVVEIKTSEGERKRVYFDITDFYGKW